MKSPKILNKCEWCNLLSELCNTYHFIDAELCIAINQCDSKILFTHKIFKNDIRQNHAQ